MRGDAMRGDAMRAPPADDAAVAARLAGRRVLVTGAGGFVGSHAARGLVAAGAEVHGLVRPGGTSRRLDDVRGRMRIWAADVTNFDDVRACVDAARPEVVFHLAADTTLRRPGGGWEQVARSVRVNLEGTLHVLRAAAEADPPVQTFVRTGGIEEYGPGGAPSDERQRERPVSPYSAGQVAATHYCQMLQRTTDTAIVTLRPALTYGPGQSTDFFVPALITSCLAGRDFEMTAGTQRRDFVYVDDLVGGLLRAAVVPGLTGAVVNLGGGRGHAIRDVAHEIVRRVGGPARLRVGAAPPRSADDADYVLDTEHAAALLGWRARTDLGAGLDRTIAAYREAACRGPEAPEAAYRAARDREPGAPHAGVA